MSKDSYFNRTDKRIVTQKPNSKVKVSDVAKVIRRKLCSCPNAQPGKVVLNSRDHRPGCRFRQRLLSGEFTIDTSVVPKKFRDGYGLAVVLGGENY
jgi:hypothetical protein